MMKQPTVYIRSAEQISMQEPLSTAWLTAPKRYPGQSYARSVDPNFRDFLSPIESRRLGKALKRAIIVSERALAEASAERPDAILTGTGLGCVEDTEAFLQALCADGEGLLKPTHFMQSTHNTIGSLIAIRTGARGYNSTYSHKGVSFDSALLDAFTQLRLADIGRALVGGHDEVTPTYFTLLRRIGYVGLPGQVPCGEAAVAMVVDSDPTPDGALCEIAGIEMAYKPSADTLKSLASRLGGGFDCVFAGLNGSKDNDSPYRRLLAEIAPDAPAVPYKCVFGESYSASALGVYAAAHCLRQGHVPGFMVEGGKRVELTGGVLVANHSDGKDYSLILLKPCGI